MLLNFVKLLALTLLMTDCSSIALKSVRSKYENNDSVDTNKRIQIEKREDHRKFQKYAMLKKSIPSPLDAFDKSGNPKVWTSFDHVHPLKRSEGSILDSVSNPLFQNKVAGCNMSNASANYPINLMYANNLTVKNYFLMMPPCNGSSGGIAAEQTQILDECLECKDKTEHSVKPHHQSTSGANMSFSYTKEAHEVTKGNVSSTETASASNVTNNNTKETTVSLNVTSSTDSNSRFSPSSVSNSTEIETSTEHNKNESLTKHVEGHSKTTMNNSVSFTSIANEKKEDLVATTHRLETTSSKTTSFKSVLGETSATGTHSTLTQLETSTPLVASNLSTPLTLNSSTSSTQSTITTLDPKASKFLQTVDKYCETFSWSDKGGTYTIRPITYSQHEKIDNVLPGKSSYKGKLSSLKDKRYLVQKIPRKNFKQILTDELDYPL